MRVTVDLVETFKSMSRIRIEGPEGGLAAGDCVCLEDLLCYFLGSGG